MAETITIPGGVDLHVHFREPGDNKSETIESGTNAAQAGGYALVCDMPNNPGRPTWTAERMSEKHDIARRSAEIAIAFYAGAQPESDNIGELAAMSEMAIGLKLYGAPTTGNERDYEAKDFRKIVSEWHRVAPEKPIMVHAGKENRRDLLGLITRDFKHATHLCHVSDTSEVIDVFDLREQGHEITCGVCPHHLFKTSHDTVSEGWFARMQPPLAHQDETDKLFDMLVKGHIDVVETDHAPHSEDAKWAAEIDNPKGIHEEGVGKCYGVPGIEFAIPLLLNQVRIGRLSVERLVEVTSTKPAAIIGVNLGQNANVTWNLQPRRIDQENVRSIKSNANWTPYLGKIMGGRIMKRVYAPQRTVVTTRGTTIYG
jgi:dihydroorotase